MRKLMSLLCVAPLMLSGCGGPHDSSLSADSPVEIQVWHYWDGTNADVFDSFVDEFNASHKDVRVETVVVPNSDFLTKVRASATSDTLPDIAIGDLVWAPQIVKMGKSADLDSIIDRQIFNDLNPALESFGKTGGVHTSIPVSANNLAYMYNKDLFVEAGLDPDNPPETWEELEADAQLIHDKTGKPGYDLFTEAGDNGEGLTWNFQVSLWQAGGEFLTKDNSAAAFNTPEGKKALDYWLKLIKTDASPYAKWGEFEKGQGGSAQEGSWMVGIWSQDPPFDFGVAQLPTMLPGKQATNLGGEQAVVFANDEKKVKASGEFLNWFLQKKNVIEWNKKTGFIPVTKSAISDQEYIDWVQVAEPRLLPYVEQMEFAHTRPNTPLYPKISFAFAKELEKAFAGEVDAEDALEKAEKAVNEIIAQAK
ncbi:extracellular solute-binding protein [Arcanobacterium phocae]|uniref:extracellular solute-binding protein n=1 Tax=Arcanobacterium phocae TaxID=131112 RepID=UPI001C0EA8DE|nr:extracellular solute-binding protein [Arcanobacterium phocae]